VRLGGLALGIVALVSAVSLAAPPPARAQEVFSVTTASGTPVGIVQEGGTTSLTVNLSQMSVGITVNLTSSSADVTVPATVSVPFGGRNVSFTASAKWGATPGTVTINASRSGSTVVKQATLTVDTNEVNAVAIAPATLQPGQTSMGSVTLDRLAPQGGLRVDLSSSKPADVPVPSFVIVPTGGRTATFNVTAEQGAATGTVNVLAARTGSSAAKTAQAAVVLASVRSVSLSPQGIYEGATSTGTVTLDMPAAPGGVAVLVTSSDSAVTVPATVTVAAGASSATFTATAGSQSGTVTIKAKRPGSTEEKQVALGVARNEVKSLGFNATTVVEGGSATGTIELETAAGASGVAVLVTKIGPVTVPATVTVAAGASSATFTATTSGPGSPTIKAKRSDSTLEKQAAFTVTRNQVKSLAFNATTVVEGGSATGTIELQEAAGANGVAVLVTSSGSAVTVPATVTVAAGASSATFTGTAGSPGSVTVTAKRSGSSEQMQATVTVNPNEVKSLALSPTSVTEGKTATGTVTLEAAAGSGGTLVALGSSSADVTVPADVTVAAGATTATFTATAKSPGMATLSAKRSGSTTEKGAALTVAAVQVKSVTFSPAAEVKAGASVTGTVTLDARAPSGGVKVALKASGASVTLPADVTVAAGSTTATFTVTAGSTTGILTQATIEASRGAGGAAGLSAAPKATATLTIKK
jgi:hypothetical protein